MREEGKMLDKQAMFHPPILPAPTQSSSTTDASFSGPEVLSLCSST